MKLINSGGYPLHLPNGSGFILGPKHSNYHYIVPCVNLERFQGRYRSEVSQVVEMWDARLNLFTAMLICDKFQKNLNLPFSKSDLIKDIGIAYPFITTMRLNSVIGTLIKEGKLSLTESDDNRQMSVFSGQNSKDIEVLIRVVDLDFCSHRCSEFEFLSSVFQGKDPDIKQKLDSHFMTMFSVVESSDGSKFVLDLEIICSLMFMKYGKGSNFIDYLDRLARITSNMFSSYLLKVTSLSDEDKIGLASYYSSVVESSYSSDSFAFTDLLSTSLYQLFLKESERILSEIKETEDRVVNISVDYSIRMSAIIFWLEEIQDIPVDSLKSLNNEFTVINSGIPEVPIQKVAAKVYEWLSKIKKRELSEEVSFCEWSGIKLSSAQANHMISMSSQFMDKLGFSSQNNSMYKPHITGKYLSSPDLSFVTNPLTHFTY